jgi:hypothetical protein
MKGSAPEEARGFAIRASIQRSEEKGKKRGKATELSRSLEAILVPLRGFWRPGAERPTYYGSQSFRRRWRLIKRFRATLETSRQRSPYDGLGIVVFVGVSVRVTSAYTLQGTTYNL